MSSAFQRISAHQAADLILRSRAGTLPLALFDVRDQGSYAKGHITGADHLNERELGEFMQALPAETPVMIYCYHGNASQVYAQMFADFRFKHAFSVDGGYEHLASALVSKPTLRDDSTSELAEFIQTFNFEPDNLNAIWDHGLTPLMRASLLGRYDLAEELLDLGVNIHLRNMDGNNALWLACVSDNVKLVQLLIDFGIDINNCNDTGATTLMYTASSGKAHLTKILLDAGADASIKTFDDFRAVDLAASEECLRLLRHTAN